MHLNTHHWQQEWYHLKRRCHHLKQVSASYQERQTILNQITTEMIVWLESKYKT